MKDQDRDRDDRDGAVENGDGDEDRKGALFPENTKGVTVAEED